MLNAQLPRLTLLAPILSLAVTAPGLAQERPPNVVVVLADDLGWGEVGAYGQTRLCTPHIDRLAAEGARLTAHYSGSPVCAPSRCVLLTGLHTGHAQVRDNWENGGWGERQPEGQLPLDPGTLTLPGLLRERGYATCAIGKWGLGGPVTGGHPVRQGFDHFFGYLCQRKAHNYYPTHLWRNEQRVPLPGNGWFRAHQRLAEPLAQEREYWERYTAGTYAPDAMIDEALGWLEENAGRPFFLYYASPIPHAALQVQPEDLDGWPGEWDEAPYLGQKSYLPHPRPRAAYAAMVAHLDAEVGALLDKLDELGVADETLVIFTSDNGPTFNGGTDSTFFQSAGPFRGLKCSVYEGGIRVPFVARFPGRIPAGRVSDHVSGFQDLLPTLVELSGAEAPAGLDGRSLWPALSGVGEVRQHELLYWEYAGQQAARMGRWKAVRTGLRKGDLDLELYDLVRDPGETTDLAATYPDVAAEMSARMAGARTPSLHFPQPALD